MKRIATHFIASVTLLLTFLFQQNSFAQSTVVLPGNFQSELGCPSDWMPDCDATRLVQTSAGIWEGTFLIPGGSWEYKVAYDNKWDENYGQSGYQNGANIWLVLGSATSVHFTYSSFTHLVDVSFLGPTVVLAGSFQSEKGCTGDWQPDCDATRLTLDTVSNIWFGFFAFPNGNYEYKVALNNSWAENYGLGGVFNGPNIPLTVSSDKKILFRYNPVNHIVTILVINYSVILAGDFQSELGCSGDWQPNCPMTGLTFDAVNNLWKGQLTLQAGNWQFKVTLDDSWDENYGEGGVPGGPNIQLNLSTVSKVSFEYNPDTHIIIYKAEPVTVVIPGSFQSKLGCPGDWDPACNNTRLTYDAINRVWTGTFDIPAGYWEYKVAVNNSWSENYGMFGIPGGPNIPLNLEVPANITFNYDPLSHLVTLVFNTTGLCATAFYDANVNGYNDENIPMEGVALDLWGKNTAVKQYAGSDGKTCFTSLVPGVYTVEETVPGGYIPTTLDSQTVYLTQPQTLYFGTVCLGGAGAQDIGFWMNKHGKEAFDNSWNKEYILQLLSYLNLRNNDGSQFVPRTYEDVKVWLQQANAKNMAYMLSAQLATLLLNVETGLVDYSRIVYTPGIGYMGANRDFMYVYSLIWHTGSMLYQYPTAFGGDKHRSELESLKNLLQQANSDLIFVQLQPCSNNVVTSIKGRPEDAKDLTPSSKVVLWPNPSGSHFNLRPANGVGDVNVQIRVMDVQGKQVYIATGSAQKDYRFGEDFIPGLYFVEIIQGSTRSIIKIVKQ